MSADSLRNRGVTTAWLMIGLSGGRPVRANTTSSSTPSSAQPHHGLYAHIAAAPITMATASAIRNMPRTRRVSFALLAALRQLLRLRRQHQRPDRHASDFVLPRQWHTGSPRRRPARPDGHVRSGRHDAIRLVHRPLRQPRAAVLVLRTTRPVAPLPAVLGLQRLYAVDLRDLLRSRLAGDGAADGSAGHRRLRQAD